MRGRSAVLLGQNRGSRAIPGFLGVWPHPVFSRGQRFVRAQIDSPDGFRFLGTRGKPVIGSIVGPPAGIPIKIDHPPKQMTAADVMRDQKSMKFHRVLELGNQNRNSNTGGPRQIPRTAKCAQKTLQKCSDRKKIGAKKRRKNCAWLAEKPKTMKN